MSFDAYGGEIHALVGENGAGKSTLMKILYGFYRPDAGEIRVADRPVQIRSPHDARELRIGMVFQDFAQIPALSVADNVALFQANLPPVPDMPAIARRIEALSQRYGLEVEPSAPVWRLSVGERQKVEVVKLLLADARILIFDEPTRGLAPQEVAGLFRVFADLRRDGYAVVFITHKLDEVLAGADRISVMRRGRIAGTLRRSDATEETLVSLMFGSAPSPRSRRAAAARRGRPARPGSSCAMSAREPTGARSASGTSTSPSRPARSSAWRACPATASVSWATSSSGSRDARAASSSWAAPTRRAGRWPGSAPAAWPSSPRTPSRWRGPRS